MVRAGGVTIGGRVSLQVYVEIGGVMQGSIPHVGDVIEVTEHRVGEAARLGEVLEVIGEPGHEHFRVRWENGGESIFYPSSDATVRPAGSGAR